MSASAEFASRAQVLRALGVMPLRLRVRSEEFIEAIASPKANGAAAPVAVAAPSSTLDKRCALQRLQSEIEQPALANLYTKITEAISALGLQCVRMTDAERDPHVRVLAFGGVVLPASIDPARVLRVDTLATLESDRGRKRAFWQLLQKLAREAEPT